jgi:hypothetical protein
MTTSYMKSAVWAVVFLLLLGVAIVAAILLREAKPAADHSAHDALTAEICDRLAALPQGQPYPESLLWMRLPSFDQDGRLSLARIFRRRTSCFD